METNDSILSELREISPVVAAASRELPYYVPHDYFASFPTQVLLRIALDEKTRMEPSLNISKENVYHAPDGYFENFAGLLLQRIKAQDGAAREETEFLSPILGNLKNRNPFTTPEGYFTDFTDNVVAGLKAVAFVNEELENLSPDLAGLKNKNVYTVPGNYFENNAALILAKAKAQQPGKLVSMNFGRKAMRYAAAACVALLIGTGAWLYLKPAAGNDSLAGIVDKLRSASDDEIQTFSDSNTVDIAGADTTATTVNTGEITENDSKDLLADIPDDVLQKYVEQHGEAPVSN